MSLLAALSAAILVYLAIGARLGIRPTVTARVESSPARLDRWRRRIERSGLPVGLEGVALASVVGSMVGAATVASVTGSPALALMGAVAGALGPIRLVERTGRRRDAERRACWPDALRDLTTRLRSGSSVHSALTDLATLGPLPLRPVFERYSHLAVTIDQRVALENVRAELADPLSDRIVEVLLVAFDQGTRVVIDVLDDLATAAVDDLRLLADIDAAKLETELEARGAAVLPFVVLAMLCLGSDGYREFYGSAAGSLVILLGATLSSAGLVAIARLGRVASEPRTIGPVAR